MKKIILTSVMMLAAVSAWAAKSPIILKMVDGTELRGDVKDPKIDDDKLKFFPEDGGKTVEVNSRDVATLIYLNDDGSTSEYEYVPIVKIMDAYKQLEVKRISGYLWLFVERRGYMTLYHNRSSTTTMSFGGHGMSTSTISSTTKYCRRPHENGATLVVATASAGSNKVFKTYAGKYFTDDQQILDKIEKEEYTYKDIDAVVEQYNSRHGN